MSTIIRFTILNNIVTHDHRRVDLSSSSRSSLDTSITVKHHHLSLLPVFVMTTAVPSSFLLTCLAPSVSVALPLDCASLCPVLLPLVDRGLHSFQLQLRCGHLALSRVPSFLNLSRRRHFTLSLTHTNIPLSPNTRLTDLVPVEYAALVSTLSLVDCKSLELLGAHLELPHLAELARLAMTVALVTKAEQQVRHELRRDPVTHSMAMAHMRL
jgi:hypothetical protein